MNLDNTLYFARKLSINLEPRGHGLDKGWISGACPFAEFTHASGKDSNASFGILVNSTAKSYFKCFACGQKGSLAKLAFDLARVRDENYTQLAQSIELAELETTNLLGIPEWQDDPVTIPEETLPNKNQEYRYPAAVGHPYLTKRGLDWQTCTRLRLRFDSYANRILFPVYDYRHRFRGFTGRLIDDRLLAKRNPRIRDYLGLPKASLFLGEHFVTRANVSKSHRLIITEGPFDFAAVIAAQMLTRDYSVIAILGSEITAAKYTKLLSFDLPIIWFVDNDQAGKKLLFGRVDPKTNQHILEEGILHRLYGKLPQFVVKYPKNTNGKVIKDPGDCLPSQVKNMILAAKLYIK